VFSANCRTSGGYGGQVKSVGISVTRPNRKDIKFPSHRPIGHFFRHLFEHYCCYKYNKCSLDVKEKVEYYWFNLAKLIRSCALHQSIQLKYHHKISVNSKHYSIRRSLNATKIKHLYTVKVSRKIYCKRKFFFGWWISIGQESVITPSGNRRRSTNYLWCIFSVYFVRISAKH